MNRIITIRREFGSGGRELGKRLSEKAMEKKIRQIDAGRAHYRQLLADSKWNADCWFGEALQ
ncbi:MAG: hypothetical protein ACERKN_10195 [Velocimicrobium sp.]